MTRGLGLVWHTTVARFRLPLGPMVSVRPRHPSRRRRYLSCGWASEVQAIHSQENSSYSKCQSKCVTKQKQGRKIQQNKHTRPLTSSPPQSQFIPLRSPTQFVKAEKNATLGFQCCRVCTLNSSVNEKGPNQTPEHCGVVSVSI